jgi:type IV pilus assembly protein PilV
MVRTQAGFSLLEVLVALLILSVALIGLQSLQSNSLRNNHSALLRSQAVVLVGDILERMRANVDAATAGNYNISYASTATAAGCSADCSAAQVAADDLFEWRFHVARLPGGQGQVNVTAAGVATVDVRWTDSRDSSDKVNYQVVTTL